MKTESEIYKACVDAGVKVGDLIQMSRGESVYVSEIDGEGINLSGRIVYNNPNFSLPSWPVYFCRIKWEQGDCPRFVMPDSGLVCMKGNSFCQKIPYPPTPDQKSIEERVAVIEMHIKYLFTKI